MLDQSSSEILSALSINARCPATHIADSLEPSPDPVLDRIRELEKHKVIICYSYVLNNDVLNQVNYYVLIYLNNVSKKRENAFVQFCHVEKHVLYLIKSPSHWDYEISVEAPRVDTYRDLMQRMNYEFSDIVQRSQGMMVRRIHKYIYP